jgi:hypothetical protein
MSDVRYDVRNADGWSACLSDLRDLVRQIATEREMQFVSAHLFCEADPCSGEAWSPPGVVCIVGAFTDPDQSKDEYAARLKIVATAGVAIASVFITEAWMARRDSRQPDLHRRPADDPDRIEALFMQTEHRVHSAETWYAPITTVDGRRVVGDWQSMAGDDMGGRFTGILQLAGAPPFIIAMARAAARRALDGTEVEP